MPVEPTSTIPGPLQASVVPLGPEEMVYDWTVGRCSSEMHPDLPAQAFRSADGTVNLVLSSPTNHRLVGPDLDSLVPDCTPIRFSAEDADPGAYRFREWIGALYTDDGETIHAVIHNEFHGDDASEWSSRRDFALEQGAGGWTYLGRSGPADVPLEIVDDGWRLPGSLCLVENWGAHPGSGCDAVRRWTAADSGDVSIWVSVADVGIGGGNGVDVGVRHNGQEVWTATLEEGDTEGVEVDLAATVEVGDQLDFFVGSRDNADFDATAYEIEINPGPRPCPTGERDSCQFMALTYSRSIDGGATFTSPEPNDHLIAAIPQRYEPDHGAVGLWQPSNIVKHPTDGYYYMLTQIDVHQGSRNLTGLCLLRTDALDDPSSWRAWDGDSFDYVFIDPYSEPVDDPAPCPSVLEAPAWSLTYNTFLERFVAVSEIPRLSPPGVYFRTSPDLIEWSAPQLIVESAIGFATEFKTPFEAYPSLLDPASESMSFETTGQSPYLYYTRINTFDPLDFDLLRIPIRFEK